MAQVKQGDTVKVHYTGKLEDGSVFDTSVGRDPLSFEVGSEKVIAGFESAVLDMSVGEKKTVTLDPQEAYGPVQEELIISVERANFPPDIEPEVGQQLEMHHPSGQMTVVTVTDVQESTVTLDANHPLAGKSLIFEIEIVEIG